VKRKVLHLPVKLTDDELRAKGSQQAAAMIDFGALEAEKRELSADLGARLKAKRKELDRLAVEVRTGLESRPVECELVPVWGSHTVVAVRRDTGEQVEARPMSYAERQLELEVFEPDDEDEDEDEDSAPH
jgi:imidazolonepropionase-like amidohydrolase